MENETREKIALKRYQIISPVLAEPARARPRWPLENPPSVAGSKSPSDRALTSTLFSENRQSFFLLHP